MSRWLAALALLAAPAACAPTPKNVPCQNAAECESKGAVYRFCVESRCVECLEDAACGENNRCTLGLCEKHCKDGRDCVGKERCESGFCAVQ